MKLIIGAAASGKLSYIRSLGYPEEQLANAVLDTRPVLYNLQDLVAYDPSQAEGLLAPLLDKEIVACDEVGAGVIPVSPDERFVREAIGRLCNQLAQQAESVVRLVAGIPQVIKDSPNYQPQESSQEPGNK